MAHPRRKRTRVWRNNHKTLSEPSTISSEPSTTAADETSTTASDETSITLAEPSTTASEYSEHSATSSEPSTTSEDSTECNPTPTVVIKTYVNCSVQTENELPSSKKKHSVLRNMESVTRITHIPIVESGWHYAENIYKKIKETNSLVHWTLDTAESSAQSALEAASPAIILLQGPISSIDKIVCKSLDIVEQAVPSINLPPEMIYWNTKQYVTDVSTKIAQPVLKRADSVKQIGNTVLASKYTAFAADTLDGALDVAEKYVDKYLPADEDDQTVDENHGPINGPRDKAIHTIQHVDRFSRKLRRRLTQRTIAEVEALKQQSAEAVHVLIYVVELVTTDPILAFKKGKELWADLSKDEPENQARPENLEQLIVLLTRESARRIVHLINFTGTIFSRLPKRVSNSVNSFVRMALHLTESVAKTVHMEELQKRMVDVLRVYGHDLAILLKEVNTQISELLEQTAENLSNKEVSKSALSVPEIKVQSLKATVRNSMMKSNGIDDTT